MSKLKLVSVAIVIAILGVLLAQNREPLLLKFFCPDIASSSCVYQTPTLPLAVWMGIFIVAGVITSLIWQFLSSLTSDRSKTKSTNSARKPSKTSYRDRPIEYTRPRPEVKRDSQTISDWEQDNSNSWDEANSDRSSRGTNEVKDRKVNNSVYSSKAEDTPKQKPKMTPKDTSKTEAKSDRKQKIDDVYDATYRTIGNPNPATTTSDTTDDEEWI